MSHIFLDRHEGRLVRYLSGALQSARWAATHAEALGIARPAPTGHSS